MKTVLEVYGNLWPAASSQKLGEIIRHIAVAHYPSEAAAIDQIVEKKNVVIVVEQATLKELIGLVCKGFGHLVQKEKPDFAHELLVATLMAARPNGFLNDPKPFFLANFDKNKDQEESNELTIPFNSNVQKPAIMDKLNFFLMEENKLMSIKDICIQVVDELYMNAMFSAPVDTHGNPIYQQTVRTTNVTYPSDKTGKVYSCYSPKRAVVGVIDPFGSLNLENVLQHLQKLFEQDQSQLRNSMGGAGIGLKYIIENSALFYLFLKKNTFAFIACGFELRGLKHNLSEKKHIHIVEM